MEIKDQSLILLTGATGYVGGRLLPRLVERGFNLRCLVRKPEYLKSKVPLGVEIVPGDVLKKESLLKAMQGVHTAYYLVHSMASSGDFTERDRIAAQNFAEAARRSHLKKIVYLGGLCETSNGSRHLASREEVGKILRASGVPTVEFQASIIIGSGSFSFEMVRSLVEHLPVMVTPRWVRTLCQPIAIEDVVAYLTAALDKPYLDSQVFPIGGAERVSYGGLMREYARQRGLWRLMIPVPLLTPGLSSLWLGLVTPVYARVGRQLIEGLRNESVVNDFTALKIFPIKPLGYPEAIARAIRNEDRDFALTRWSDALSTQKENPSSSAMPFGRRLLDTRAILVPLSPEKAFQPIEEIGGRRGWYYANILWKIRGWLDLLVGGAGLRRGRRDPEKLGTGDALDFWRVEQVERPRLLRLAAEMKVPGRAWLQFEVTPEGEGSLIRQTALFDPLGLGGKLYWYLLYPVHKLVFAGMLKGIAREALKKTHSDNI
jgi:uncharacterized protein YbjT (DUF2867 family)